MISDRYRDKLCLSDGGSFEQAGVCTGASDEADTVAELPSPNKTHFVYFLRCGDGSYYCGYSTDPVRRAAVHNSGKGAKYTRSRLPVELVYTETQPTREAALSREWHLKRLSHREKAELAEGRSPAARP